MTAQETDEPAQKAGAALVVFDASHALTAWARRQRFLRLDHGLATGASTVRLSTLVIKARCFQCESVRNAALARAYPIGFVTAIITDFFAERTLASGAGDFESGASASLPAVARVPRATARDTRANGIYLQAPWPVALHDPVKFEPPPPRGPWISDF